MNKTKAVPPTSFLEVTVRGREHVIAYFDRQESAKQTILYVHGLGASKNDFSEMCSQTALEGFRLIAYDHPGCNESPATVDAPDSIDVLVEILEEFVSSLKLRDFLLVGGSLGGLVSLLFAERNPSIITGFVNVEGNLAPEDCMFSRKAIPDSFLKFASQTMPKIKQSLAQEQRHGFARHLEVLNRADVRAYYAFSFQTVAYSDNGHLLERFLRLSMPLFFLYGSDNRKLSYLPRLSNSRCEVVEVDSANHFLFYDNPDAYAKILSGCSFNCAHGLPYEADSRVT